VSEISSLLDRLAAGEVTLERVTADFAARRWVKPPQREGRGFAALAAAEESDFDPIVEGSWAEVETAYVNGVITAGQYRALFDARAGSDR
jgi:hypothetical protein